MKASIVALALLVAFASSTALTADEAEVEHAVQDRTGETKVRG